MAQARSTRAINRGEKQGSVIYSTDQEKRLVRYLLYLFILKKSAQKPSFLDLAGRTVEYGLLN